MPCVLEQLLCREAHTAIDTASVESRKAQEPAATHVVLTRAYHRMHATAVTAPANVNTLQVPQLIENYKSGSADGISLVFLAIWFIGDVTNLFGALWAGLVPTVIALAMYFCVADLV